MKAVATSRGRVSTVLIIVLLGSIATAAASVSPPAGGNTVIQRGYSRSIEGRRIAYHSPLPGQREALIVRARGDWPAIAWETDSLRMLDAVGPGDAVRQTIRLAWLAGLGCNLGSPEFRLDVAGIGSVVFRSAADSTWRVAGEHGLVLAFHSALRDRHGDLFGIMVLDVPCAGLRDGQRLALRITGSDAASDAWVMTFAEPLVEGAVVHAVAALVRRTDGGLAQPVDVDILHLGEPAAMTVRCPECAPVDGILPFGFSKVRVLMTPVQSARTIAVEVVRGHFATTHDIAVEPVRPWTVSLVQHTHTDIGYTRPQTEILAEHLRYIDTALDYCDLTDAYPEEARFRWTCEAAWPVAEYLRVRPAAQIERLRRRVLEGRIEVTAMPMNLGEVADENVLRAALGLLAPARAAGLPVRTAMQNDVNGIAWCLIDAFQDLGIRNVWMGEHTHRALEPFDRPTQFWWESPSGNRVLAFRADHYMTGNFWGILPGDPSVAERNVLDYLHDLGAKGYPFEEIAVQASGYFTDNAPPSTAISDFVRRWNETYASPRMRTETAGAFLERIERDHAAGLPSYRAAWPDWWTDGFGSAMRETAALRRTQTDLVAAQGLLAMAGLAGEAIPPALTAQADEAAELLLFANEHTFGAAESVRDPLAENSMVQWMEKASYVWQAVMRTRLVREGALALLRSRAGADVVPTITVYNTLNVTRSGVVTLFADHALLPQDGSFEVIDARDRAVPVQWISARPEGSTWMLWASDVPPFGWASYRVRRTRSARTPEEQGRTLAGPATLENGPYRVTIDPERGGITAVLDKETGLDLADGACEHALGAVLYERLDDRASMEHRELGGHRRAVWSDLRVEQGDDGPLWTSVHVRGRLEGFEGLHLEIRLYKTCKRIELVYEGRKQRVTEPEAVYVALPFALPGGHLEFEAQGGTVVPGIDQLPGTASDWNTIQAYAAVRGPRAEIVLVSDEAPLVQFGGINTGRYEYEGRPASNRIYSWVLNNYWVTNFCASQEGDLRWSYQITSNPPLPRGAAAQHGWSVRVALVAAVQPPAPNPVPGSPPPPLGLDRPDLLLVGAHPSRMGHAIVLHLREIGGKPMSLDDRGSDRRFVNALDEEIALQAREGEAGDGKLSIPAFGTRFLAVPLP